jgi:hypothetical protein
MQLIGDPQYVKQVKKANKKGYTYLPELYKDKFDGQAGGAKRQKLPRPIQHLLLQPGREK